MKYVARFTVVYSKRTGVILGEIWEPFRRIMWPLPWTRLPGRPRFDRWEDLMSWFESNYPGEKIRTISYGTTEAKD